MSGLCRQAVWQLLLAVVALTLSTAQAAKEEALLSASTCLQDKGSVALKCAKQNQKISIRSVSYAYTPDCNNPVTENNDCTQTSQDLSEKAQKKCNGLHSCSVAVVTINELQDQQRETHGLNSENIERTLGSCNFDRTLQTDVTMNLFLVKYECEEFEFCSDINKEVIDLTIATPDWPVRTLTNPKCGCVFESADQEDYYISGFTHCNGTVTFISKETNIDGTVQTLEYRCENKFEGDTITIASQKPYKIELSVDVEKSDEETAYQISWYNVKSLTKKRSDKPVKVECEAGGIYIPRSVQIILMTVLPIVGVLLIALIIIYCICKSRRRKAKDWRARHVRLPPRAKQAGMEMGSMVSLQSRSSSLDSFSHKRSERVDPEGNVDDIGEFAAMLAKKNEERRRQTMEKRQGYQQTPPVPVASFAPPTPRTPPPARSTMQPSRRAQSIGNLRSDRRYAYTDNLDNTPDPKPLSYSKSASQSRASVRSLKRRAPQPSGPPQVATPDLVPRPSRLPHTLSTPSIHRTRSRPGSHSQPVLYHTQPHAPGYHHPTPTPRDNAYATPYTATPSPSVVTSPGYSDAGNSEDEMAIMRPGSRAKPAIAAKPKLPPKQNPRHGPMRSITPGELGELQRELDASD